MITIQDIPWTEFNGRAFNARRENNFIVIEYNTKTADSVKQEIRIPVKHLSELKELVEALYGRINK